MLSYKRINVDILVVLASLMPFFDWHEDLISFGGIFYLNIYKIFFLIAFGYIIIHFKSFNIHVLTKIILIFIASLFFIFHHGSFENLKGFLFVLLLIFLSKLTQGYNLTVNRKVVNFLQLILFVIFIAVLFEVFLDKKFITPDFRDNHRQFLGLNIRRVSLTFLDPNYLAFHVGMIYLLIKYFTGRNSNLLLLLTVFIILLTGSRGGMLAFIFSIFLWKYRNYLGIIFKIGIFIFPFVLFILLPWLFQNASQLPDMYFESSVDMRTIVTRLILWTAAFSTIVANPIFGIGHGKVSSYGKSEYLPFDLPDDVNIVLDDMGFHNYWMELVVENGVFFAFILIMTLWRKRNKLNSLIFYLFIFLFTSGYESPFMLLVFIL